MIEFGKRFHTIRKACYGFAAAAFIVALTGQFFLHEDPVEFFVPGNDHCIACQFANSSIVEPAVVTMAVPEQQVDSIPRCESTVSLPLFKSSGRQARSPPVFPL